MPAETLDNLSTASVQYTGPGAGLLTGTQMTVLNNNTSIASEQTSIAPAVLVCDTEMADSITPSQTEPQVTENADQSISKAPLEQRVNL
jgi:hypothetical protein